MTDEDAEVMQPGSGEDNLAVVDEAGTDIEGQLNQAGLMAEFIHRLSLRFHVIGQMIEGIGGHETFVIFWSAACSGRIAGGTREFNSAVRDSAADSVTFSRDREQFRNSAAGFQHVKFAGMTHKWSQLVVSCLKDKNRPGLLPFPSHW
jgi:hypothetical protein